MEAIKPAMTEKTGETRPTRGNRQANVYQVVP